MDEFDNAAQADMYHDKGTQAYRELEGILKAIDPREQALFTVRLTRKDILCLPMETRRRILSEQVKRLDDMNLAEYHHFID